MDLPVGFIWIPGYRDRYAMRYHADSPHPIVVREVYSFVYPGHRGFPMKVAAKRSNRGESSVSLRTNMGIKRSYTMSSLIMYVIGSPEYKQLISENRTKAVDNIVTKIKARSETDETSTSTVTLDSAGLIAVPEAAKHTVGERLYEIANGQTPGWIIGRIELPNRIAFMDTPNVFFNEAEAYAESERMAKFNPGEVFVVVKTVRTAHNTGITVHKF